MSPSSPPSAYVPRPRLDDLCAEGTSRRLLLLTAGAGFGKTTLLDAWVRALGRSGVWLTLGPLDADPRSFAARLLEAVRAKGGKGDLPLPETEPEGEDAEDLLRLVGPVLRAAARRPGPGWIVLDDAHVLAAVPPALRFLELLANHLPSGVPLILASREHLPLATARLRARGEAVELTSRDLAFTTEETAALFARRFPGQVLSTVTARRLAGRTEGWAAGLEIFLQSLHDSSEAAVASALSRPRAAGPGWFTYFAEEVLAGLAPATRGLLLRASILPRLTPELCGHLLGASDGARLLALLHRRHLFVYPVERGRGGYRMHHLFQRFLRRLLDAEVPAVERRALWQRSAAALRRAKDWPEALTASVEAGDTSGALRLLEDRGEALISSGRYGPLRRTLERIPERQLRGSPAALRLLGRLAEIRGDWPQADTCYRRALRAGADGERRIGLLALRAQIRMRRGDHAACLRLARGGLDDPALRNVRLRGRLLALTGVSTCELGRLAEGEALLRQALTLHRRSGDDDGIARVHYLLMGNVHVRRGNFAQAVESARAALLAARRLRDPRRICHSLAALAYARAAGGQEATARSEAQEALRLAELLEYRMIEGYAWYTLGLCDLLAGDAAMARERFEAARRLGERVPESGLRTFPLTGLARAALAAGNRHAARRHAERALAVARSLRDPFQEAEALLLLGSACGAREETARTDAWKRAERLLRRLGMQFDLHRLLLLRLDAGGRSGAAGTRPGAQSDALYEELLGGAARREHDFLFVALEPPRGARVLAEALRRGIESEYASGLLTQIGAPAVEALARSLEPAEPGAARERAARVLARIDSPAARALLAARTQPGEPPRVGRLARSAEKEIAAGSPAPLAITALGPLRVETAGRRLAFGDWRSARARRLFTFLMVHRFRWVPLDVVLEALWPGVDPERGLNNLSQSAWWLRGALDPANRHPLRLRRREEACRLDPGDGYTYDVEEFERELARADEAWNGERRERAEPHLRRALELYAGEFLAECPYEEFAAVERERLRDRFRRALGRLMQLEVGAGRWDAVVPLCRRGVREDPLNEELQQGLIRGLHRIGRRQEALEAYHRFEAEMVRELGLPPSARMRMLAAELEGRELKTRGR